MRGGRLPFKKYQNYPVRFRRSIFSDGFTIIEVLVVLAVSGMIFLSAALMIGSQQNSTQFQVAANDFYTEMRHIINDINNGYYPNLGNFNCYSPGGSRPQITAFSGSGQGANTGCIFLGKAIQFNDNNLSSYVIAGDQYKSDGVTPAETLSTAYPILIAQGNSAPESFFPPISPEIYLMKYGLTLACGSSSIKYFSSVTSQSPCLSGGVPIGSVAFVTSPTTVTQSDGIQSGDQQINLVPMDNTSPNTPPATSVDNIDKALETGIFVNPAGGVKVCLNGSDPNYSALITIGGMSRQPTISLQIKGGHQC